jgi:hypothetical protein
VTHRGTASKKGADKAENAQEGATEKPPEFRSVLVTSGADLVSALAWPLVALGALLCLKQHLIALVRAFTARVASERTNLAIGSFSLTAQQGELEALRNGLAALRAAIEPPPTPTVAAHAPGAGTPSAPGSATSPNAAMAELDTLADKYAVLRDPSRSKQINLLNQCGQEMAAVALKGGLSHAELAAKKKDGFIVALAFVALINPREEDVNYLCDAVPVVKRNHARYLIAMALGALATARLVASKDHDRVLSSLDDLIRDGDPSLNQRIHKTRAILTNKEMG